MNTPFPELGVVQHVWCLSHRRSSCCSWSHTLHPLAQSCHKDPFSKSDSVIVFLPSTIYESSNPFHRVSFFLFLFLTFEAIGGWWWGFCFEDPHCLCFERQDGRVIIARHLVLFWLFGVICGDERQNGDMTVKSRTSFSF